MELNELYEELNTLDFLLSQEKQNNHKFVLKLAEYLGVHSASTASKMALEATTDIERLIYTTIAGHLSGKP